MTAFKRIHTRFEPEKKNTKLTINLFQCYDKEDSNREASHDKDNEYRLMSLQLFDEVNCE